MNKNYDSGFRVVMGQVKSASRLLVTDVGYCWLLVWVTAGYWCGLLLVSDVGYCWLLL